MTNCSLDDQKDGETTHEYDQEQLHQRLPLMNSEGLIIGLNQMLRR